MQFSHQASSKGKSMPTYRVPVVIRGFAMIKYPGGKGAGDYAGGLPRDAEAEAQATVPFLGAARLVDYTVELNGQAQHVAQS
jgi:hypothetical protein